MNIYDIAELAGVSIATVSRVVNDSPMVSEKTKQRVRKVMEENDYTPNVFARGLGLNSMKTVGLMCPDIADAYMARAVAYLEQNLKEHGYNCILYCSGYDIEERHVAVHSILQKRIDALVLIGSSYAEDDENSEKVEYIREAAKQVPVFMMNGCIQGENIYCALCNDFQAAYMAVTELLQSGREEVLFLSDSHSYSATQKLRGYKQALKDAGLSVKDSMCVYVENKIDKARDLLLSRNDLMFDAVFATEDGLAVGALKYAKKRNLSVPRDISIIGYNNSELSVCCDPELSTVDSRGDRLCKIIIDSMMLRLKNREIRSKVYANGFLIRRETTDF
ncbi:LacI family DNA-binding transcriptional regulator [Butyricicoccus sp.]|uniref:LacI family DNA-binding transcriptional regulator n=1 Tax=Butyricicoccus sp. TaxID=2049021 RepID=UPI003D7DAC29